MRRRGGDRAAGAPGVGKTRLAQEAVAAVEPDVAVEWTATTAASASIPFGPLAHLLAGRDIGGTDDPPHVLRGVTAALVERAGDRPLLLAVDDAHWLDPGAATLVHQLVVTGRARVLVTVRTGEAAPDPIVGLWKDGLVERLELQPLTLLDVESLVASVLGGVVERSSVRRLFDLSGGDALFLRELVLGTLETGALATVEGVWRWAGRFRPSTRLSTTLQDRLGRVSADGTVVLEHLAVGEPLGLDTLVHLCGRDGLAQVERAGLVVVDDDERRNARLAHPS